MRRPGQILRGLFSRDKREKLPPIPVTKEHSLPPIVLDAHRERDRRANFQMVHATKQHPGAKKVRSRARNKRAKAARKVNYRMAKR